MANSLHLPLHAIRDSPVESQVRFCLRVLPKAPQRLAVPARLGAALAQWTYMTEYKPKKEFWSQGVF